MATKAQEIDGELVAGPRTLGALRRAAGGASKGYVLDLLRKRIEAGEVERLVLLNPAGGAEVRYRAAPSAAPGRRSIWHTCETCGRSCELGTVDAEMPRTLGGHSITAARLLGRCDPCRRRAGELPPQF